MGVAWPHFRKRTSSSVQLFCSSSMTPALPFGCRHRTWAAKPSPSGARRYATGIVPRHASSGSRHEIPASHGRRREHSQSQLTVVTITVGNEFPHVATEPLRAHPFVKRARRAITSEEECMAELARIREVGYATAIDETTDGVAGVAAPIMGVDAKVIAGPAVLMPTAAWGDDVRAQDLDAVCAAAEQVSKLMGYQAGLIHESLLEEPHCLGKKAQLETQETQEGHEQCNAQRGPESCAGRRLSRTPSPTQPGLLR